MNKKKLSTLLISLLAITTLAGCDKKTSSSISSSSSDSSSSSSQAEILPTAISLNKTETSILLGSNETLVVTYTPDNVTNKDIVWSSDNTVVATVDENGKVTAVKVGTAIISATYKKNPALVAKCEVTVRDNVVLASVNAKHEFVLFEENKNKDSGRDDGFYNHEETYKVGDDNVFNVKPSLTVLDAKTYQPVSASRWTYDYVITAKSGDTSVGEEFFKVVDARECDVQFTSAAVGKTFTINVTPGGIDASRVEALTKSLTVEVVDGYNVYNAKELGYFDTRPQDFNEDTPRMENDEYWTCKWAEFKTANGLKADYFPASLIFQTDIKVTVDDLPANFFYDKDTTPKDDPKALGSLIDYIFLYERTIDGDITVDGNYFELDLSEIPLVKRDRCQTTEVGSVVSHSAAFKAIAGGDVKFCNINMTGNSKKAESDDDRELSGGFIFVKGAGSRTLTATNMIATKFYITFMGEKAYTPGNPNTVFNLDKVKCYNDFNSFMYNWGSTITASNSLFRNCGGPVIIQDHAETDEYERDNGFATDGFVPETNFVDCTIKNYVNGTEAWFQQFGATALVQNIKSLSDLLGVTGLTKSFVTNDKGEGKYYAALAAAQQPSFFNFIVLNKSGRAEGATNVPACGVVNIVETDKTTTFNYRQPNAQDTVYQAYQVYAANPTDENKLALIAAAVEKGVTFAPDYSDAQEKIQAYLTNIAMEHVILRGLNTAGAPVFDLGGTYNLLSIDGVNNYLQTVTDVYLKTGNKFVPSAEQLATTPNYMALYYNGMALVMGLTNYVA